jgi:hypothetical protein
VDDQRTKENWFQRTFDEERWVVSLIPGRVPYQSIKFVEMMNTLVRHFVTSPQNRRYSKPIVAVLLALPGGFDW